MDSEQLISAVFKCTPLWDQKNKNHQNRFIVDKSWAEIAEKMKKPILMDESKLTMMQRNKLNYFLRSGDSLPSVTTNPRQARRTTPALAKPCQRRSRSTIMQSGIYERDQFKPEPHKFDRETEKARLQSLMAYGKLSEPPTDKSKNNKKQPVVFKNRFDQLKEEIDERIEWLTEMEALGQAEPHRQLIKEQIAVRIREMEKLKPESS